MLITQVSFSTIPPCTPRDFYQNFAPTLGLLHPSFCRGWGFIGIALSRGGHLSINDFYHFWNFHYNGKNWRLTTLWGWFVALKFYMFLKKIIQSYIEIKPKNKNDFSDQRLRMQNSLIVRHLIFGVLWKICLYK